MPKKIPMRQCLGCREMKPKKELIRVVKSPEGEISLDFKGKKPGRGGLRVPQSGVPEEGAEGPGPGAGLLRPHARRGVRRPGGADAGR